MKKLFAVLLLTAGIYSPAWADSKPVKVRIGHFSNVTHAQAVVGHHLGWFEERLAPSRVEWSLFNAGPSAIEAIFAGQLDIAYIGPSPAINGFVKSGGEALRIISGAASGGAALVVRSDLDIKTAEDFRNRKIASPQLGNTQDVSLRAWVAENGLKLKEVGGDVQVLPIANADQVTLFLKKEIDASWSVEPWVTILEQNAGGRVYLDEATLWPNGEYATTVVVARKAFLEEHPEIVKRFLDAHEAITVWINQNPEEARKNLRAEITKEVGRDIAISVIEGSFKRIRFNSKILRDSIQKQAAFAKRAGFLKVEPDFDKLFAVGSLEEAAKK